jgi:seryl-tRNA synthetase
MLTLLPNPPADDTPDGFTDDDAEVVREVGELPAHAFTPRDHLELAQAHGWIDAERAARISGSRFVYRVGDVALLELALYRHALDRLVAKGFVPMLPPVLVRDEAMYDTGFFPTDEMKIYAVERDELYVTGTSEVALASRRPRRSTTSRRGSPPSSAAARSHRRRTPPTTRRGGSTFASGARASSTSRTH